MQQELYMKETAPWQGFMPSAKLPFFLMTNPSLAARSSAVRFSGCSTVAGRQLPLRFAFWEARSQVTSKFHPSNFQYRNTIGGKCNVGESARRVCRREAKSPFVNRRRGSAIAGR